ncbi:hypothetical protein KFE98_17520 [bacterium SCSIO 12741]|nr:hypothetical protein KFE98_17520 [bacterium SCSIO 12741]
MNTEETLALQTTNAFQSARRAAQKDVHVSMSTETLIALKREQLKLCFAKKVGDSFNVVWKSEKNYLVNNKFSWQPAYQLFATNKFRSGVEVQVHTNKVTCGLGETSTMNKEGVMLPAVTGGPQTALTFDNDFALIHAGVCQLSEDDEGNIESEVIFVDAFKTPLGHNTLTPKEEVMIWFERNVETGTMFSEAKSNPIVVNLTHTNQQSVFYDHEKGWRTI